MESNWLQNEFIWKELRAPYIINYDTDYYETLKDKYEILLNQAIKAKADEESIEIIKNYKKKILEALNAYYSADLSESSTIIRNLFQMENLFQSSIHTKNLINTSLDYLEY